MATSDVSVVRRARTTLSTRFFTVTEAVLTGVGFLVVMGGVHLLLRGVDALLGGTLKLSANWPISVFYFHPFWTPVWAYALTVAATVLLFVGLTYAVLRTDRWGVAPVLVAGLVLVLATNMLQSYQGGFVNPIAGGYLTDYGGIQYYHDAIAVGDPLGFVSDYAASQPDLKLHSRTHPPGAVLSIYVLSELLGGPGLIAVAIAVVATLLTGASVYGILKAYAEPDTARYVTYLFLLLPATQIYFAASLDALITAFLVTAVYAFTQVDSPAGTALAAVCVFLASFQTFLFVLVVPVLVGYELLAEGSLRRSALVLGAVVAAYLALFALLGFNYVESFLVAMRLENAEGSLLFRPLDYVVTRLEGIAELLVFFSPFMLVLAYRGRAFLRLDRDLGKLVGLALLTLFGVFAVGLFKTGETARALLFFYPFFVLPVLAYVRRVDATFVDRFVLATLVFGQTFAMQLVGYYFW